MSGSGDGFGRDLVVAVAAVAATFSVIVAGVAACRPTSQPPSPVCPWWPPTEPAPTPTSGTRPDSRVITAWQAHRV